MICGVELSCLAGVGSKKHFTAQPPRNSVTSTGNRNPFRSRCLQPATADICLPGTSTGTSCTIWQFSRRKGRRRPYIPAGPQRWYGAPDSAYPMQLLSALGAVHTSSPKSALFGLARHNEHVSNFLTLATSSPLSETQWLVLPPRKRSSSVFSKRQVHMQALHLLS